MNTILVPTDFSKNALTAAKYACAYAEKTKSKIVFLNSYLNPTSEFDIPFTNIHVGKLEAQQGAGLKMKKMIASLLGKFPDLNYEWIVQPGIAANNIVKYVQQNRINLVIMGTTGQGAVSRVFMGSTTSEIIANAPCTIIDVPSKAKFTGITKIAVATELSKISFSSATGLIPLAKQHDAEITFVFIKQNEVFDVELVLETLVEKAKKQMKYDKISFYIHKDSTIANGLDAYIKQNKPDIFSMLTHERTFPETIWKTSLTDVMSNHIQVPLLVLHLPKAEPEIEIPRTMDGNIFGAI